MPTLAASFVNAAFSDMFVGGTCVQVKLDNNSANSRWK
jgi:hypothetical protein